jgi:prepilin-type N-terminal cleavage/methylation domain-containing protein
MNRPRSLATPPPGRLRSRGGFTIIELLIALAISAMLLTATLGALDASWRSYKTTTESASTHVISRIVITRILALIRTGTQFGPYPADFLDPAQNPVPDNHEIEFIAESDRAAGNNIVTRIERRATTTAGLYDLWYVRLDADVTPPAVIQEHPMLRGVREALFILEYDPGPKLKRATVDLTIQPNDVQDGFGMGTGNEAPTIRLVASAVPRQIN